MDVYTPATRIADEVRRGALSPVEVVDSYLGRIEERDDEINAYIEVLRDEALERAREAERAVERGDEVGPLHGVPFGLKDLTPKAGVRHTKGLVPLSDNVADYTAGVVERLEDAGGILLGTTNTPELGHRMRTDNRLVGPTATPFDTDYNAGGSSGGSGAALAAGMCALATGSDVGGSLRNPASCCGVVSVKPTFGLVPHDSRPNAFLTHTPFGVRGPMARTVDDLGLMLDVIAGRDDRDPFSVEAPETYREPSADASELDLGYSADIDYFPVAPEVRGTLRDTLDELEGAGATVEEVGVDGPERSEVNYSYARSVPVVFAAGVRELNEEHGFDLLEDFGDEVPETLRQVVMSGQGLDTDEYTAADVPRTELYDAVESALEGYDALVCPTLATPPLTHDEPIPTEIDGESVNGLPMDWSLAWIFNMTGHPVVNVPAGTVDGLPVGMQVVGRRFDERRLLEVASAVEDVSPWEYPE